MCVQHKLHATQEFNQYLHAQDKMKKFHLHRNTQQWTHIHSPHIYTAVIEYLNMILYMYTLLSNHLTMDVDVSAKVAMESRQTEIRTNFVLLSSPIVTLQVHIHCHYVLPI